MNAWTLAPLRCVNQWREKSKVAREFHIAFYYVWCLLGTPFWVLSCFGYVACLVVFPSAVLGLGLTFVNYEPGVGWFVYATAVIIFWISVFVFQVAVVLRQLHSRVLDIEAIVTVILISLSFIVAAWYLPHAIGGIKG